MNSTAIFTMEDIKDADYKHVKIVWEDLETQSLAQCHDLFIQSNTFLVADVFANLLYKYIEMYDHPAYSLSATGLAWQV